MKPITREEYYLAKIAGTWQGKTPEPVTIEEYYLATMAGDYSGNTPQPVTRLQYYMAKAAGVWGGSIPAPVTRLEYYWAAIAGKEGHIPDPVTRQEYLLYAISQSNNDVINTVFGATIIINDAAEGRPFRGLRVFGQTEQMRTSGAQLLSIKQEDVANKDGLSAKVNVDGGITVTGTPDKQYATIYGKDIILSPGKYYLNGGNGSAGAVLLKAKITFSDGSSKNCANGSFEVTPDTKSVSILIQYESATIQSVNYTIYPMLNKGETALPFEPYTGGKPSPSPEYPQEIVSAGESGTINVSISDSGSQNQSLTLATPNGLPGVPVSKDGNYTDADGQQWVCDEIDLERGKYVQRVVIENISGGWELKPSSDVSGRFLQNRLTNTFQNKTAVCNIASFTSWGVPVNDKYAFTLNIKIIYFSPPKGAEITAEELNAKLNSLSFPVVVVGELATPIERDLTPEEIAAYKALRTYGPTTVITNDAGTGMEVAYVVER